MKRQVYINARGGLTQEPRSLRQQEEQIWARQREYASEVLWFHL